MRLEARSPGVTQAASGRHVATNNSSRALIAPPPGYRSGVFLASNRPCRRVVRRKTRVPEQGPRVAGMRPASGLAACSSSHHHRDAAQAVFLLRNDFADELSARRIDIVAARLARGREHFAIPQNL